MSNEKRRWSWRRKLLAWCAGVLVVFACLLFGLRGAWVRPIPGVSVEMTRPPVLERDLGPGSAYRLYLAALREIVQAEAGDRDRNVWQCYRGMHDKLGIVVPGPPPGPVRAWSSGWRDVREKLRYHPWPTSPPPPAPPPKPGSSAMGMFGTPDESDPHALAVRPQAPWTLEQYEEIRHGLRLHQPGLPILDRALAAPDPRIPTLQSWFEPYPLPTCTRNLCTWLAVAAHTQAAAGNYAEACRDLRRALGTADLVTRGGALHDVSAAWACDNLTSVAVRRIASRYPIPRAMLCQMAADFLHQADSAEPFVECIRAEFIGLRNFVPAYYRLDYLDSLGYLGSRDNKAERFAARLAIAAAPLAGSTPRKTVRNLASLVQHWVVLAQKPYSTSVQDEYDALERVWWPERTVTGVLLGTWDPLGYLLAGDIFNNPGRLHAWSATHLGVLRGTALALAIRAFQMEHGALPNTLKELVPDYLPRVPDDPFSGKPFRYLPSGVPGLPAGAWAVYSFGGNCIDDGGTAYTPSGFEPYREPDLVIPSQTYPRDWQLKHPPRQWYPGGRSKPRVGPRGGNL